MGWKKRLTGAFYLGTVWCPCIILAGVGGAFRAGLKVQAASLLSSDCYGYQMKYDLQHAYEAAGNLKATCVPSFPGLGTPDGVADCQGYGELQEDWYSQLEF